MTIAVPPSLLFEYEFHIPRLSKSPSRSTAKPVLPDSVPQVPFPSGMAGAAGFGEVRVAWHQAGLAIRATVRGRKMPVTGSSDSLEPGRDAGDVVHLWLNTRPGTDVRRATRHCHWFSMLPVDAYKDDTAQLVARTIAQQRDAASLANVSKCRVWSHVTKNGYDLSAWLPAAELTGYREVPELRRLGFYFLIEDSELGVQPLLVSEGFPYSSDPSLWPTLELAD